MELISVLDCLTLLRLLLLLNVFALHDSLSVCLLFLYFNFVLCVRFQ